MVLFPCITTILIVVAIYGHIHFHSYTVVLSYVTWAATGLYRPDGAIEDRMTLRYTGNFMTRWAHNGSNKCYPESIQGQGVFLYIPANHSGTQVRCLYIQPKGILYYQTCWWYRRVLSHLLRRWTESALVKIMACRLSPERCQAIIWTNADILSIRPQEIYFTVILFEIHKYFHPRNFARTCCLRKGGYFFQGDMS